MKAETVKEPVSNKRSCYLEKCIHNGEGRLADVGLAVGQSGQDGRQKVRHLHPGMHTHGQH